MNLTCPQDLPFVVYISNDNPMPQIYSDNKAGVDESKVFNGEVHFVRVLKEGRFTVSDLPRFEDLASDRSFIEYTSP